jgi:PAS domain S-box-containing protein
MQATPAREISPFWYKRICEVALLVSSLIFGLHFLGRYALDISDPQQGLFVPDIPMYMAGASALFSLLLVILRRKNPSYWLGLGAFIATGVTIGTLLLQTGGLNSPFIALWLMMGVLSGMFGSWVWLVVFIAANAHAAYQLVFNGSALGVEDIVKILLIAEAPLLASFIIWHKESKASEGDKKAYNALAAQLTEVANKSEIVINSIADGVVALDTQGSVQLINPAAQNFLGWPKQDAVGLNYKSIIKLVNESGQEVAEDLSPIKQVLVSGKPANTDSLNIVTKTGKKVLVSMAVTPVVDQTQNSGVILVFRDITRERQEERERAEFISTASHEMRTPVAAIEGYLGLAMNPQTATIDDKARTYLQKAYESTEHLGRLFQDLLTVSRAEDNRLMTKPATIDVTQFMREIAGGLTQKAKDKGIALVFTPDSDGLKKLHPSYFMHADPNQMREVLSNLLDNAIKYTKQGTVTVYITGNDTDVSISVADTGIGIPPEDIAHLFQKFYRVDNSDTREIGGTGLGLYISRRLVETNGGSITVTSTFGKGSTFTVKMPRTSASQTTVDPTPAAPQVVAPAQVTTGSGQLS